MSGAQTAAVGANRCWLQARATRVPVGGPGEQWASGGPGGTQGHQALLSTCQEKVAAEFLQGKVVWKCFHIDFDVRNSLM